MSRHAMKVGALQLALYLSMYACLWQWEVNGVEGAGNLLKAQVALQLLIVLVAIGSGAKERARMKMPLPDGIAAWLSLGMLPCLAWYGHWLMGVAWLFVCVMSIGMRLERKQRQQGEAS
ncbi:hypothetical protein [Delftia tsuruhatensis]|uniref:DUF3325 family protein n=2 Tax=Delftia tsuruhatensis TaxID=180282 RepID=A0ABN4SGN7_9BURK|nr:hypothetical protein [Delftia tsuruhatensis]AOV02766.1 hypothetical protein BI380_16180 [Delftia tsuruhatensis]